jgi:glycosyltransferase involved in cell wall biosynthesis
LRQNQLTIDALLDLWRRQKIATPLVIYGQQGRVLTLPANVAMPGYAEDIRDIYDGRSIVVSPSLLGGGLKTKVLEAFAYAVPVIGNQLTFEGIDIGRDYPLVVETESDMLPLLKNPDDFRERLERAAAIGLAIVRDYHDPADIARAWSEVALNAIRRRHMASQSFDDVLLT